MQDIVEIGNALDTMIKVIKKTSIREGILTIKVAIEAVLQNSEKSERDVYIAKGMQAACVILETMIGGKTEC